MKTNFKKMGEEMDRMASEMFKSVEDTWNKAKYTIMDDKLKITYDPQSGELHITGKKPDIYVNGMLLKIKEGK